MYNNRHKFTILQIFRTARVLETADYIAVNLGDSGRYQVIKGRTYGGHKTTISLEDHNENMLNASMPIVLSEEYLETDEEGLVIFGW